MFDFIFKTGMNFRRNISMVFLLIIGLAMMFHWNNLITLSYIKFPQLTWMRVFGGIILFIFLMIKKKAIQ